MVGFGVTIIETERAKLIRIMHEDTSALKAEGFSATDAREGGFGAKELLEAGYSPGELHDAGFSASQLKWAGCAPTAL